MDPDDDDRVYDDGDGTEGETGRTDDTDGETRRKDDGEDVAKVPEPVEEHKDTETEKSKYLFIHLFRVFTLAKRLTIFLQITSQTV